MKQFIITTILVVMLLTSLSVAYLFNFKGYLFPLLNTLLLLGIFFMLWKNFTGNTK